MNIKFSTWFLIVMVLNLWSPTSAISGSITVGPGMAYLSSPYKDHDNVMVPFPLIHYEGEKFFVRGTSGGFKVYNSPQQQFVVGLSYHFNYFDPDDTTDKALQQLSRKPSEIKFDARYIFNSAYGTVVLNASQDISGHSNGATADVTFRRVYNFDALRLMPSLGVTWESAKTLDYFYGISTQESLRSGLKEYSPASGLKPHLGLLAIYSFNETWSATIGGTILFLSDEIKDSPMVDASSIVGATVGLNYSF